MIIPYLLMSLSYLQKLQQHQSATDFSSQSLLINYIPNYSYSYFMKFKPIYSHKYVLPASIFKPQILLTEQDILAYEAYRNDLIRNMSQYQYTHKQVEPNKFNSIVIIQLVLMHQLVIKRLQVQQNAELVIILPLNQQTMQKQCLIYQKVNINVFSHAKQMEIINYHLHCKILHFYFTLQLITSMRLINPAVNIIIRMPMQIKIIQFDIIQDQVFRISSTFPYVTLTYVKTKSLFILSVYI
ncbi:hypothetical protein SS50377_22725 [Spironucleus salmonicida]|uniref:Uncharacterized protein n=1 Tax=Spironucleus salmonicida TaxID=348837 RepID=A0A9P8LVN2_9EUKA|nr:hypothetical protein SS50377_22725 [Spironucleus salmonicida]